MNQRNPERHTDRPSSGHVLFNAVLQPRRSATKHNLNTAVLIFALGSLPVSVFFGLLGAWPVAGFVGLDLVFLFLVLRFHHWSGKEKEIIRLTDQALTIRRVNCWGAVQGWEFSPYWLRINIEDLGAHSNKLEIQNREQRLTIGNHLSVEEKKELCHALRCGLDRLSVWAHHPA